MSARQWFPSGWVCSKRLQLLCVACLKLKIVVRISRAVWGVSHLCLLCRGENGGAQRLGIICDFHPQGGSLPGPDGAHLPGNSKPSVQYFCALSVVLSPTTLYFTWNPASQEENGAPCAMLVRYKMSISGIFTKGPIFHRRTLFSREVVGWSNNNRDIEGVAAITKPAANIPLTTSYGPRMSHKIISFDFLDSSVK